MAIKGTLRKFGKVWHIQYYDRTTGKKTSKSLGVTDKREAAKLAKVYLEEVERLAEIAKDTRMLKAAIVRECGRIEREVSLAQATRAQTSLAAFCEFTGEIEIAKIDTPLLERFQRHRLQTICPECRKETREEECPSCHRKTRSRVSKATITMDLFFIRHMLKENGILVDKPKRPGKAHRTVIRAFTRDEVGLIFAHVTDRQKPLYATLLFTGARPAELVPSERSNHVALLKKEVDLDNDSVLIRTAKAHHGDERKPRLIKIPPEVSSLLKAQMKETRGAHVFPPCQNLARNFNATLDRAGIPRVNELGEKLILHSFRHTYGTMQAQSGLPALILKEIMGHAQVSTTERYVDNAQSLAPVLSIPLDLRLHTQDDGCEKEKSKKVKVA